MRLYHVVLTVLPVLSSYLVSAGSGTIYARRPDDTMTMTASNGQTGSVQPTRTDQTNTMPLQTTSSIFTSMIDLHTDVANPQPTAVPSSTNATEPLTAGALPLAPKITPALGVAAVVLIITGMVYGVIGIKNQWIHVFLSAAFLTSLSVTVLIIYVMSPPVSDAVQGAYFVAAFFTGVVFGALCLVFKELTEGLGCILGGFCLSMWILSLKAGSLLTSSGSRGIFIGAFCAATYALSFTSYTRPYALMASTAFAGSTAAVLGIDCFSRAGLKEFWLYTWGLNDDIFPLNTSTYPVTRGIRVELAIIIIICLIGLLSQFRLWKVVRERRKRKASQRAEEKRQKDEAEAELSRKLEEDKTKDLALWEAVYGNPGNGQSTAKGMSDEYDGQRCSTVIEMVGTPGDSVEMKNLGRSENDPISRTTLDEEDTSVQHADDRTEKLNIDDQVVESVKPLDTSQDICEDLLEKGETSSNEPRPRNSSPNVTPLPFAVPVPGDTGVNEDYHSVQANLDDAESVATRISKRLSGTSLLRRLSNRKSVGPNHGSRMQSESKEMLVPVLPASASSSIQGIVDDDEDEFDIQSMSSVAETVKHETAASWTSGKHPYESTKTGLGIKDVESNVNEAAQNGTLLVPAHAMIEERIISQLPSHLESSDQPVQHSTTKGLDAEQQHSLTEQQAVATGNNRLSGHSSPDGLGIVSEGSKRSSDMAASILPAGQILSLAPVTSPPVRTSDAVPDNDGGGGKRVSSAGSKSRSSTGRKASLTAGAVDGLPSHVSPVVMSYRTNEWAKHLSAAETPDHEPIQLPHEDETSASPGDREKPAPVNVEDLQQTAVNATPLPAPEYRSANPEEPTEPTVNRSASSVSRSAPEVLPKQSPSMHADRQSFYAAAPILPRENAVSSPNLPLNASTRSPPSGGMRGLRSSSSPFLSTSLATLPIRESEVASFSGDQMDEPNTLMAQRESIMRRQMSSVSLTRDSWVPPRSYSRQSLEDGRLSRRVSELSSVEDDDMPLAQRRTLLQQADTAPERMSPDLRLSPVDLYATNRTAKESNMPRSTTMAVWRESLRQDLQRSQTPLFDVDVARNGLMEEQRKAQMARRQRNMASEHLHNSIAERMQRGDMRDLHRQAMRRMQAAANQKAMDDG